MQAIEFPLDLFDELVQSRAGARFAAAKRDPTERLEPPASTRGDPLNERPEVLVYGYNDRPQVITDPRDEVVWRHLAKLVSYQEDFVSAFPKKRRDGVRDVLVDQQAHPPRRHRGLSSLFLSPALELQGSLDVELRQPGILPLDAGNISAVQVEVPNR